MWSSVSVCTSRGKRPTKQWIQPLFQCHSKDPLRQKSSITLLSIQYGIYTLHDSTSLCSSAAVNMGNLTSILQVHRSAKVQYIVQNGLGQQKKSNSSLHCAPTKCCFCQFPIAIQKFLQNALIGTFFEILCTTYINIAKCKLGIVLGMLCQYAIDVVPTI